MQHKERITNYTRCFYEKDSLRRVAGGMLYPQHKVVLEKLKHVKFDSILDVGCGAGAFLKELSNIRLGSRLVGIDLSISQLKKAKHEVIDIVCCDALNLPFRNNSFDAITASEVIEHVINPFKMVNETYRVVKPIKGYLFLTVPHDRNFFIGRLWCLDFKDAFYNYGHLYKFHSRKSILRVLNKKFGIVDVIKENKHEFTLFSSLMFKMRAHQLPQRRKKLQIKIVNMTVSAENKRTIKSAIKRIYALYYKILTIRPVVHIIYVLRSKNLDYDEIFRSMCT